MINPYMILGISAAFALVLGFSGVQTYRLNNAQHEIAILNLKEQSRLAAAAKQALHDLKNKERTDAQHQFDLAAARAASVRADTRISITIPPSPSGRDEPLTCFQPRQLESGLAEWAQRVAARLSRIAQQAETVAADYRACRSWALGD